MTNIPLSMFASPYCNGSEIRKKFYYSLHKKWPDFPESQLKRMIELELWHHDSCLRLRDYHNRDRLDLVMFRMLGNKHFKRHRLESIEAGRPIHVHVDFLLDRMKKIIGEYLFEKNMAGE